MDSLLNVSYMQMPGCFSKMTGKMAWSIVNLILFLPLPLLVISNYPEIWDTVGFASVAYAVAFALAASVFEPHWGKKIIYAAILGGLSLYWNATFCSLEIVFCVGLVAVGDIGALTFRHGFWIFWKTCVYRVLRGVIAVLLFILFWMFVTSSLKCPSGYTEMVTPLTFITYAPLVAMLLADLFVSLDPGQPNLRKRFFS